MGKAIREVYGEALAKYGKDDERIVALDADLSGSTKSAIFGKACPERFLNVGIAESNMVGMAAGLASVGKIPFVNTFTVFLTTLGLCAARAFGSYSQLPIKFAGAYGGMSDAFDGPSHHALEDIAVMRSLANMQVFVPCDAVQTEWLVKYAIDTPKPIYLRLSRDKFKDLYTSETEFAPGKGIVVREGTDITVIACGLMVGNAIDAAEELAKEGISVRVIDMHTIKPLDKDAIVKAAKETGHIITAEDHLITGFVGSAVAEALADAGIGVPFRRLGIPGEDFPPLGDCYELYAHFGYDPEGIKRAVRELLGK